MTLCDAARRAREKADGTRDAYDEAVASALEATVDAEAQRMIREQFPLQPADPPPPMWSQISEPATSEGPLPF